MPASKSKAHRSAYNAGRAAFLAGKSRFTCPYSPRWDFRDYRRIVTGSQGSFRAWMVGWEDAQAESGKCPVCTGHGRRVSVHVTGGACVEQIVRCKVCGGTARR